MVQVVNREREGHEVDQCVLRLLVEMLCTIGDGAPKVVKQKDADGERLLWQSSDRQTYKQDFESVLLKATGGLLSFQSGGLDGRLFLPPVPARDFEAIGG